VLQPANPQTLQPTGSGIQVPDEQRLQTSATRDQIAAILSGESAGSRKTSTPEEEGIDLPIIPLVLGLFILGFVGSYFFDKYKTKQGNVATVGPALSKAIKEKEVPKKKPKAKGTRQAKAKARAKKSPKTS
jgi:hypothetical protein